MGIWGILFTKKIFQGFYLCISDFFCTFARVIKFNNIMKNKFFATIVVLSLSSLLVMLHAVPAYPGWRVMEQPDGTVVELRMVGDEFEHYWVNRAGERVTKDEAGYWEVESQKSKVESQKRAMVNRGRQHNASQMRKAAAGSESMTKGLIILVNFKGKTFKSANNKAAFSDMMMNDNYAYNPTYPGSAHKYFYEQSNGKYNPTFTVVGPYTLSKSSSYYAGSDGTENVVELVAEACKLADNDVDFSQYDLNKDGDVDFVFVIYAGYGQADTGDKDCIWPHQYWVRESGTNCRCDGKYINMYACASELDAYGDRGGIATFCHEFSHVLGLPDVYDVCYGDNYYDNLTPGEYHLMDGGSYNGGGYCPPNYTAYDKYYLGWATPSILSAPENVTLPADGRTYRQITSTGQLAAPTKEASVYYIENRQQSGWDTAIPGHGMLVWRITYDPDIWDANEPNAGKNGQYELSANTEGTIHYELVSASGQHVEGGNGSYPFPGTKKKTSYTPITGCGLSDIAEKNGNITFKFKGGAIDDSPIQLDVDYGWAELEEGTWVLVVYKYATREPWVQFYFENGESNKIAGTYDLKEDGYAIYWPDDSDNNYKIRSVSGTLTVTCVGIKTGESGYNEYAIAADFVADDGHEYIVNQTLELSGWDGDYALELKDEVVSTMLENVGVSTFVRKYIENGHLVIVREGVRYSIMGAIVR